MIDLTEQINLVESSVDTSVNIDPDSIMVDIEGMHSNIITGNYTMYTPESLVGSIPSWTSPYNKPCIMHHNEKDGKIIGRIINVSSKEKDTRSNTPALLFTINVPDEDGKKQIRDGRLATVSVGISALDVRCSICGENIAEHECEHKRGKQYNGETCYWEIRSFKGKELSYVITPSDPYAHNVKIYSPSDNKNIKEQEDMIITENLDNTISNEEKVLNNTTDNSNKSIENNGTITSVSESEEKDSAVQESAETTIETKESTETENTAETAPEATTVTENTEATTPDGAATITDCDTHPESGKKNNLLLDEILKRYADATAECASYKSECNNYKKQFDELSTLYNALSLKYKVLMSNEINSLRTSCGQAVVEAEELSNRTIESLEDMLKDIRSDIDAKKITEQQNKDEETNKGITENLQQVESPVNIISDTDTKENTVNKPEINVKEMWDNLGNKLFNNL